MITILQTLQFAPAMRDHEEAYTHPQYKKAKINGLAMGGDKKKPGRPTHSNI